MNITGIEWTDATWNPVSGCSKVSAGCKNCYAERMFPRTYSGHCVCGHHENLHVCTVGCLDAFERHDGSRACEECVCRNFRQRKFTDVRVHPDRLDQPLHMKKPKRIFVNSMSDLFHDDVPFEFIDKVFAVMALSPQHTFQILTKRPERMREYFSATNRQDLIGIGAEYISGLDRFTYVASEPWDTRIKPRWTLPLPNVWLGTSAEDQDAADKRIPELLRTPAAVRFVSLEPLLRSVSVQRFMWCPYGGSLAVTDRPHVCPNRPGLGTCCQCDTDRLSQNGLDWVIVGGESGPRARPMHPDWARSIRDQCQAAGVPFFFKQWGEWTDLRHSGGNSWTKTRDVNGRAYGTVRLVNKRIGEFETRYPWLGDGCDGQGPGPCMLKVGKKAAGNLLDGRKWEEFPR